MVCVRMVNVSYVINVSSFGCSVVLVGFFRNSLSFLQVQKVSKKVEKHDQFFFKIRSCAHASSFNIIFTAGMLSLFSKVLLSISYSGTKMKFLPCTVTKLLIWQLLEAILSFSS